VTIARSVGNLQVIPQTLEELREYINRRNICWWLNFQTEETIKDCLEDLNKLLNNKQF